MGYLPQYKSDKNSKGDKYSIIDALKAIKVDSSYEHRKYLAETNGIKNYSGSETQNNQLLDLLKKGKLKIYWQILFTPPTEMKHSENPAFTIYFRGYGINNISYNSNNKALLNVGTRNTQWKKAGVWCSTTAYIKQGVLLWGNATTNFCLKGGNSVSNVINNAKVS